MKRAIVTFAVGNHQDLLELAMPGFQDYAGRHGYDLLVQPPGEITRAASWHKIPLLLQALDDYDEALWLDCDIVIVDPTIDVADVIPHEAWHALVRHHTPDGEVPNCGVWYLRQPMRHTLKAIWDDDRWLNHPWWEQAALMDRLGYHHHPAHLSNPTRLYRHTHWLDLCWNSHEQNDPDPNPRFAHATCGGVGWRAAVMREHIMRAELAERSTTP